MQTVDKLHENSTNRFPLLPQPLFNPTLHIPNSEPTSHSTLNNNLKGLIARHSALQHQLDEAQQQQRMMMQLFDSLAKAERGQSKMQKKLQRRCNKDILQRFYCTHENCKRSYSSQTSLQRHFKMKHNSGKRMPPQLYRDLPPQPNLMEGTESECSEEMQGEGGETEDNRELT